MAGHKYLTDNEARRIWMLHKRGLPVDDIAFAVGRNRNSCFRVIDVFDKCENGEYEAAEAAYGAKNHNLLALARGYFGIVAEVKDEPKPTTPAAAQTTAAPTTPDNTIAYLTNVLEELRGIKELLQQLCAVWQ